MFPAVINFIGAEICYNFSCFHSHALPQQSPASEESFPISSSLTSLGKALSMRIYSETWGSGNL